MSLIELPRPAQKTPLSAIPKSMPNTPPRRTSVQLSTRSSSLANETLRSFKSQQKEQFEQVSAFESRQRKSLQAHHRHSLDQLAAQHKNSKDERKEHVSEVAPRNVTQLLTLHSMSSSSRTSKTHRSPQRTPCAKRKISRHRMWPLH